MMGFASAMCDYGHPDCGGGDNEVGKVGVKCVADKEREPGEQTEDQMKSHTKSARCPSMKWRSNG